MGRRKLRARIACRVASQLAALGFAFFLCVPHAFAQSASAVAEALFVQGRTAMQAGDLDTACARFRESNRIDPAPGTTFNLAKCEEQRGKLATAWDLYRATIEALPAKDSRIAVARSRVAALEPRLPKLTISLAPNTPSDTVVSRDNLELRSGSFSIPLPIDPGKQELVVRAKGHADKVYTIEIAESESKQIEVAAGPAVQSEDASPHERASEPARSASAPPTHESSRSGSQGHTLKTLGFVLGGVGLLAVGAGVVSGILTLHQKSITDEHCSDSLRLCDAQGSDAADRGRSLGRISTVAFIVGGVTLAAGGSLLFVGSSSSNQTVTGFVGPRSAELRLRASF